MALMVSLTKNTKRSNTFWFILYASSAAFSTYFCMYAFRKPFAVASYEQAQFVAGIDFKSALIIAQVLGYALSKFVGIKVVSEMTANYRSVAILTLVMAAQCSLMAFAVVPGNWKLVALFFNGLPLGIIWGLVFSYLEGRRTTEVLGAILSISFIVSSGVVKTVGKYLMLDLQVSEYWMPAATGAIFTIPLFISVYFLSRIPPPTHQDKAERHKREPMTSEDRIQLVRKYSIGLGCMVVSYMLLTAMRDFSDNFAAEIWIELGYGDRPAIFSSVALYTSLAVLLLLSSIMWIKNNFRAFMVNHLMAIGGFLLLGVSSLFYQSGGISGSSWMIALTIGIYLAYVPFNCLIFDRMLSMINDKANAGFLIYIADAMGYAGTVGILLYRNFFEIKLSWLNFLLESAYFTALLGSVLMVCSAWFFRQRFYKEHSKTLIKSSA